MSKPRTTEEKLDHLYLAICGDEGLGIVGLVQKQKLDDEFRVKVEEQFALIIRNQQEQKDLLDQHQKIVGVFTTLNTLNKRGKIAIGTTATFVAGVSLFWDKIKSIIVLLKP